MPKLECTVDRVIEGYVWLYCEGEGNSGEVVQLPIDRFPADMHPGIVAGARIWWERQTENKQEKE